MPFQQLLFLNYSLLLHLIKGSNLSSKSSDSQIFLMLAKTNLNHDGISHQSISSIMLTMKCLRRTCLKIWSSFFFKTCSIQPYFRLLGGEIQVNLFFQKKKRYKNRQYLSFPLLSRNQIQLLERFQIQVQLKKGGKKLKK